MKRNTKSDYELVTEFVNGKQSSLETIINRHKDRVYTYILLMVKNEALAEDIFQDTFVKVINSLKRKKYQDNGKFLSWVLRIAHNLVIDHFRKEKQLKLISNDNYENDILNVQYLSDKNVEQLIVNEQILAKVKRLIHYLSPEQKEVIIMRLYFSMSFKEIAEQTNVSINTALGRMRYAIMNLRRLIEEKQIELVD